MRLRVLSAGAAQGVVTALAAENGVELEARFGAVGTMKEALDAGTPCDLVVLTGAQIDRLRAEGRVSDVFELGRVRTGVAVRAGSALPRIDNPEALRAALLEADAIFLPDPARATAGIHFARVLETLGIAAGVRARLRAHPNGATAMRELARSRDARPIGCTQITEINATPGGALVGPLPGELELATAYAAAACGESAPARRFLELLAGARSRALRAAAGFEF